MPSRLLTFCAFFLIVASSHATGTSLLHSRGVLLLKSRLMFVDLVR